jgi:hypothetical protein
MQGQGTVRRVADPGFDGFELGMFEQLVCVSLKKWQGISGHFKAIKTFHNPFIPFVRSRRQAMSSVASSSCIRWNDLARPVVAGPSKRRVAGIAAGVFCILVGVFGVILAAVFMAFLATFITTLAGLVLLGAIGGRLAGAMVDARAREASLPVNKGAS